MEDQEQTQTADEVIAELRTEITELKQDKAEMPDQIHALRKPLEHLDQAGGLGSDMHQAIDDALEASGGGLTRDEGNEKRADVVEAQRRVLLKAVIDQEESPEKTQEEIDYEEGMSEEGVDFKKSQSDKITLLRFQNEQLRSEVARLRCESV